MDRQQDDYNMHTEHVPADGSASGQEEVTAAAPAEDTMRAWVPVEAVLRDTDRRMRLVLDQLHGAFWSTDAQLCITFWMGERLDGIAPQSDQVVGMPLFEVFGSDDNALPLLAAHRQALDGTVMTFTLQWHGRIYEGRVEPLGGTAGTLRGTIGVVRDVSDRVRAEEELRQAREELDRQVEARTAELRSLYEQAQEAAVLQERQRLARDLHDAVTQMLFSASLIAEVLPRIWERDQEKSRQYLEDLRMLTRGALAEMRTLLLELRPAALTEARLGDLLQQVSEALTGKLGLPVALTITDAAGGRPTPLPPEVRITLYRVAQEALNNIAKHAAASQVVIHLDLQPRHITLSIRDDGKGFDSQRVTSDHLGLDIMRERVAAIGGALVIESHPGSGTLIRVRWKG